MNKRGQIFLIAAIIFAMGIYSVAINYNTIKTYAGLEDYKELSENYQTEYPKVINFAIYNGTNPEEAAENFTQAYLAQVKGKDPNFGVFYLFKDNQGNLHIVNMLNNKVISLTFTDPQTGKNVNLNLVDVNQKTAGQLCINNIKETCTEANAKVSDFDQAYYKKDIKNPPKELRINIGNNAGLLVDLDKFTSMNYLSSEDQKDFEQEKKNVKVNIKQY